MIGTRQIPFKTAISLGGTPKLYYCTEAASASALVVKVKQEDSTDGTLSETEEELPKYYGQDVLEGDYLIETLDANGVETLMGLSPRGDLTNYKDLSDYSKEFRDDASGSYDKEDATGEDAAQGFWMNIVTGIEYKEEDGSLSAWYRTAKVDASGQIYSLSGFNLGVIFEAEDCP